MCQEHFQVWKECKCRGFLQVKLCPALFKTCLGPSGDNDEGNKQVVLVHPGRCDGCAFRAARMARDVAKGEADAEALSAASASTPGAQSSASGSFFGSSSAASVTTASTPGTQLSVNGGFFGSSVGASELELEK
ncbi:hypothetical protein MN608_07320 [Microdochium nivale]|nr:hypothetical protein MN608_07320 [Microdochium nivale]